MPQFDLRQLYREAREHNVAHAQVATRAEKRARGFAALAALLALFSGAAWSDLAGSLVSSETAGLIAAVTAFAAAFVSAGVAALHWADPEEISEHTKASQRWGDVDGAIEFAFWRTDQGRPLKEQDIEKIFAEAKAAKNEPSISDSDLERARKWLMKNRPEVYS